MYNVCLLASVQQQANMIMYFEKLVGTRFTWSEAMLDAADKAEYAVTYFAYHAAFKNLGDDWVVVIYVLFFSFYVDRDDICQFPVVRECTTAERQVKQPS